MTKQYHDAEVTGEVEKAAYNNDTVPILEVRADTATGELIFIGTQGLISAMRYGIEVERYLQEKIAHVRKQFASEIARDACEICHGAKGGEPGNENIVPIDGKETVMCDYCHAEYVSKQKEEDGK